MTAFNWMTALMGGGLIGVSATLLLAFNGRIAGIIGMANPVLFILAFLVGSLGGQWYLHQWGNQQSVPAQASQPE